LFARRRVLIYVQWLATAGWPFDTPSCIDLWPRSCLQLPQPQSLLLPLMILLRGQGVDCVWQAQAATQEQCRHKTELTWNTQNINGKKMLRVTWLHKQPQKRETYPYSKCNPYASRLFVAGAGSTTCVTRRRSHLQQA